MRRCGSGLISGIFTVSLVHYVHSNRDALMRPSHCCHGTSIPKPHRHGQTSADLMTDCDDCDSDDCFIASHHFYASASVQAQDELANKVSLTGTSYKLIKLSLMGAICVKRALDRVARDKLEHLCPNFTDQQESCTQHA